MATETKDSDIFQLVYDGEDIRDGEMDVFALAPALLAVGELFKAADASMNGSDTVVTTAVKSNFKEGSFEIFLSVEQHLRDAAAGLLPSIPLLGANNLVSTVIGTVIDKAKDAVKEKVVTGLFRLLGKLGGEKPEAIQYDESTKTSIFVLGNGNKIHVDQRTTHLYQDPRTMASANKVALPLKRAGITSLKAKKASEEIAVLEQKDFPELAALPESFSSMATTQPSEAQPQEKIVRIVKPNFSGGKWSVSDGSKPYDVTVEDEEFLGKVHAREVGFYDGDYYKVAMTESQKLDGRGLSTTRKIVRVIEPIRRPVQAPLLEAPKRRLRKSDLDDGN